MISMIMLQCGKRFLLLRLPPRIGAVRYLGAHWCIAKHFQVQSSFHRKEDERVEPSEQQELTQLCETQQLP
eukprot:2934039-Amphidinium_carterae.1